MDYLLGLYTKTRIVSSVQLVDFRAQNRKYACMIISLLGPRFSWAVYKEENCQFSSVSIFRKQNRMYVYMIVSLLGPSWWFSRAAYKEENCQISSVCRFQGTKQNVCLYDNLSPRTLMDGFLGLHTETRIVRSVYQVDFRKQNRIYAIYDNLSPRTLIDDFLWLHTKKRIFSSVQ